MSVMVPAVQWEIILNAWSATTARDNVSRDSINQLPMEHFALWALTQNAQRRQLAQHVTAREFVSCQILVMVQVVQLEIILPVQNVFGGHANASRDFMTTLIVL
jgi:hypothetical protein